MDLLPDDQAPIAERLAQLASGPGPRTHGRIMEAVSRAPVGSASPLPPRFRGGREHRSAIALLLTFTMTVPLVTWNLAHSRNYHTNLSPSVMSLVGGVDEGLASQISFDSAKNQYVFNASGKNAQQPAPTDTYSLTVGANKSDPTSTYSVDLPVDPAQGFTYYDNHLQLSFTLIPQFPMGPAQESQGRIVYPLENGGEAIYTVKNNGLREDLVFTQPTTTANFTYQLKLPDTLQAQNKDGLIGIYSADPSLFGNITFGNSDDQTKVMNARTKSAKTNLVFDIAPPTVADMRGNSPLATYSLKGDQLQVAASGLSSLTYPMTIDPSIVVNSTADFATGNNEDDNIDFPANKINRGGLTGGVTGTWTATSSLVQGTESPAAVAYNGYVYEIGGCIGTSCGTITNFVSYAAINNTNGTLGTWTATTSLPTAIQGMASVVYNGYVYVIGGCTAAGVGNCASASVIATVDYAAINADGTLGSWTATTGLPAALDLAGAAVYNGYVYAIGGWTGSVAVATVDYAALNANGTIGSWTATTALPSATSQTWPLAYDGYLYDFVNGGSNYAPLNANGTVGTWATVSVAGSPFLRSTVVAFEGYIYELGGCHLISCSTLSAVVNFAQINANGTVGSLPATSSLPAATELAASVAYNGYLYEIGGCTTSLCSSAAVATVDYAKIQPAGTVGSGNPAAWTATTSLPTATRFTTSVAYNGYVYSIGGCASTCPTTVVDYVAINANGTLATPWNATTALPTATEQLTAIAYNGFLYEIGGCTGACAGATAVVEYDTINANGTLGATWTATTSLPLGNRSAGSVAYNGFMYSIGGCESPCPTTHVYYDQINSNGTLGATWTATSALPVATHDASSVLYGGYIYEIGGLSSAVVDYVLICTGSNNGVGGCGATAGTLGTWTGTTSLPAAVSYATAVAYDGYLYSIGGCPTTCPTAVVNYAPINTNGTVGSWTATASLPAAMDTSASVVYNGFLYEVGGSTTQAGAASAVVDYAPINNGGPGTLGSWTATQSLPTATRSATSVAYNGYVYEIGGFTTSATSTVDYAPLNANGTIGSWTATTSLPVATYQATSVAYNGYLYEIGGYVGTETAVVDYAPINSNGTLGSWAGTTSLPTATQESGSAVYNGYLYEVGGFAAGNVTAVVDYAPINPNGTLGSWTATTSVPVARDSATSVVNNGYLYEIGGEDINPVSYADVYYAALNGDGSVGSWSATTQLPVALIQATSVVYDGYMYEIGGTSLTAVVDYAPINANGTLGPWTATTSLPAATAMSSSVVYNGYVYEIGGYPGAVTAVVDYAPLNVIPRTAHYSKLFNEGASGGLTGWTAATPLSVGEEMNTSIAYNGFLYELGGCPDPPCVTPDLTVYYTTIGEDGTLGTWSMTSALISGGGRATSVAYNGYLYYIGGFNGSTTVANVDYAKINGNGALGTWTATTALPVATEYATSVAYNGYVYEIGGATTTVDFAPINVDGTLGSWTATTALPVATQYATSVAYNGYVYEIGGFTTAATANVYYAQLNAVNGTVGTWTATTGLPVATNSATSAVYNGYMYEIGQGASSISAVVDYAPINGNGTIGSWTPTFSLPAAVNSASAVAYNGYLYQLGGDSGGASVATVDYAPITYPIPIGTLLSITYTGTLPGGTSSISYETAGSNGLLTASATAPTIAQGNCISGSIQYIWVRITMDDSQVGGFADSIGTNNANLTSFTINYLSHPPANQRLHGGKFFSNNVQGPLDTCHP